MRLAFKGALGKEGAALFAAWSAQAAKNDRADTAKALASVRAARSQVRTIAHLAMERGSCPEPELVRDGTAPNNATYPASALIAKLSASTAVGEHSVQPEPHPAVTVPPPPAIDRLGGALGLLVGHILRSAIRPQRCLTVGAARAALGKLMGRKVRAESDLRANLDVLGIAESGGG